MKKFRAIYGSNLLFRGQADSRWPLTTTLERNGAGEMLFQDYYRLICSAVGPQVSSFASVQVPEYSVEVCKSFSDPELLWSRRFPPIDVYRYMAYLRHHGFPSP